MAACPGSVQSRIRSALHGIGSHSDGTEAQPEENKQTAWSKEAFLQRVSSYTLPTWFAKPAVLSPPEAARHGWTNTAADELACASCSRTLNCIKPDDADATYYEELAKQLHDGHGPLCPWRGNPASVDYFVPNTSDAAFAERIETLRSLTAHFAGTVPPHPPIDTDQHTPAALALAATGWQRKGPIVICALCGASAPADAITLVHSEVNSRAGPDPLTAAPAEGAAEPEVAQQPHEGDVAFDCRGQHRHFCPWAASVAAPAETEPPAFMCGSLAAAAIRRLLR